MKYFLDTRLFMSSLIFLFLLFWLPITFKVAVAALLLLLIIVKVQVNNLFIASFLISIITFQFFVPNKYYSVPTIQDHNFRTGININYMQGYGLNLHNIFLILTLIALIKERLRLFKNPYVVTLAVVGVVNIFISFFNSIHASPFSTMSAVTSLQYSQLYLVAIFTYYLLAGFPKGKQYLNAIIICSLVFQSSIALIQFVKQSPTGSVFETGQGAYFSTGLDENNALYRVEGTFGYHNQFAIILVVLFTILITQVSNKNIKVLLTLWATTGLVVVLTQSRTSLIAFMITSLWLWIKHKTLLKKTLGKFGLKKVVIYLSILLILLSPILVPRLILSTNIFSRNGAIETRILMINESLKAINYRPLFGFGPLTNEFVLFSQNPTGVISMFTASVHNGFISLLLEIGIIGLTLLLIPFLIILRKIVNQKISNKGIHSQEAEIFILGSMAWFVYYVFQPHNGIIEFPYIGIILGYGITYTNTQISKKDKTKVHNL